MLSINSRRPAFQPYWVEKLGFITTLAGTVTNTVDYTTANLLTNDLGNDGRSCQLRAITVDFSPLSASATGQPMEVQLVYDTVDGTRVAMTRAIPLSATNRTTLGFVLPRNIAEYRGTNDTSILFSINVFNRANTAATAETVYYSVSAKWDLAVDVPTTI